MGKHVKNTVSSPKNYGGYDGRIDFANLTTFVKGHLSGTEKTVAIKTLDKYCDWMIGNLQMAKEGFKHLGSTVAAVASEALEA